jgi:hypothetical protein
MKVVTSPQSGRLGTVVYVNSRYGLVARQFVVPRNPRTDAQQNNRANFASVSSRWRALTPAQRSAWGLGAANKYAATSSTGQRVSLNGFNFFVGTNARRAHLNLPLFDLPPSEPSFNPNPVAEGVATNVGGNFSLKLRVPAQPAEHTLVQAARPVSSGVRRAQHFCFVGLLPILTDGWADITQLYVDRYGLPPAGTVIFIRTCQQIDGWADVPKLTSILVPAPS